MQNPYFFQQLSPTSSQPNIKKANFRRLDKIRILRGLGNLPGSFLRIAWLVLACRILVRRGESGWDSVRANCLNRKQHNRLQLASEVRCNGLEKAYPPDRLFRLCPFSAHRLSAP